MILFGYKALFKKEWNQFFRDRMTVFNVFVFQQLLVPLLFAGIVVLAGLASKQAVKTTNLQSNSGTTVVGVYDQLNSDSFVEIINDILPYKRKQFNSESEVSDALDARDITFAVIRYRSEGNDDIVIRYDGGRQYPDPSFIERVEELPSKLSEELRTQLIDESVRDSALIKKLRHPADISIDKLGIKDAKVVRILMLGIWIWIVIGPVFAMSSNIVASLRDDFSNGLFQQICIHGGNPLTALASKFSLYFIISAILALLNTGILAALIHVFQQLYVTYIVPMNIDEAVPKLKDFIEVADSLNAVFNGLSMDNYVTFYICFVTASAIIVSLLELISVVLIRTVSNTAVVNSFSMFISLIPLFVIYKTSLSHWSPLVVQTDYLFASLMGRDASLFPLITVSLMVISGAIFLSRFFLKFNLNWKGAIV